MKGGGDGSAGVLDVDADGLQDMAGNALLDDFDNAVTEVADTFAPVVLDATLDYNAHTAGGVKGALLVVAMSETVNGGSVKVAKLHLNNAAGADGVAFAGNNPAAVGVTLGGAVLC